MDLVTTILLIIIPYIIYRIVLYYLQERQDIELSWLIKNMIFIIIDILIIVIANSLGL